MIKIITTMLKPELLAPAGDWKSFVAAVEAGADAVYFGGKDFSARSFAVNLTREEIKKAIDYSHLRGVKCYAAVNTLVKDSEFAELFDYINFLYSEGIDALIIQDLGVLNLCRKYWPDLPLHASTQMSAHNLSDVLELEKLGFRRVVLARELTTEEILNIKKNSKIELECFVHGALCFSYSGQCFLSSMIGGRSGNRGKCAQPCRKKYALIDAKTGKSMNVDGYFLSTRDLCALDVLDKMQFIDSLKVEGRMKSAAYVGGVVEKYRKAIDALAQNKKISKEEIEMDRKELAGIFNRGGFSHGYLLEKKPEYLISPDRSKNFGVLAGEVIEARNGAIKIRTKDVWVNDGLEIWGRLGQEKNIGFRVEKMSGDIINIFIEGNIRVGDKVYKNYDYKLNKKLEALAEENYQKKVPMKMIFQAKEGENISLEMNGVKTKGAKAEKAIKIRTSEDVVREQLGKLGNTPFFAGKIDIEIIGNIYIPLKNLNNLRREAAEKLKKKIINSFKREKKQQLSDTLILPSIKAISKKFKGETIWPRIAVQSDDRMVLDKLAEKSPHLPRVALGTQEINTFDRCEGKKISRVYTALEIDVERFHKNNIEVYQALPRILRDGEKIEIFADYDGYLVPALGYLEVLPPEAKKIGDFSLNIFNDYSVRELEKIGFSGFTASLENTLLEINGLREKNLEKEAIVYGYLPLMISEHCVLYKTKYCKRKNLGVKDETGKIFPLSHDCANCRMQILNSVPLYFTDIEKVETDSIRLVHTIEQPEKILKIVENYISGDFESKENTTTGHFNRGAE